MIQKGGVIEADAHICFGLALPSLVLYSQLSIEILLLAQF